MPFPRCYTMTMQERKQRVHDLVERFTKEKSFYTSKSFKEAETRLNFIDPFLECLGWDVKNEEGKTESFKNVKVETNQIQGQNVKHPDYALRLGMGQTVLYVEAKQPSINLKDDPEPALQVRRYGYTSKLNLSLLTDFEELSIYDTTIKPKPTDKVSTARIEYYTCDQYVEKFEELYEKYSYEACNSGKMTFFAESSSNKKGTASIDDDILQMIEEWRLLLANDIALNNQTIDEYDLTGAVQKIIDRIIFLRICEDKSVEDYGKLKGILQQAVIARNEATKQSTNENGLPQPKGLAMTESNSIYSHLKLIFISANDKYNAGLFAKDDYIDSITISDKTLTKMIKSLYYPECQYEWSVLPVEILGTIYERFLGKIIQFSRKTKNGHNITVIEKPEVQKAGGVYYTPGYIVQYIVEQTIGAKIKDKTPEQISKMRFVDPACGSGSFLVGAYDYLLRYHLDYYVSEKNIIKSEKNGIIYKDAQTGEYKLSIAEKRRILVNNIYGVDLDLQATEVSKVSLFLKLLENEGRSLNTQGQGEMFKTSDLAQEKILPFMGNNIKCGNSLVGTDFVNPGLFESKEEFVKVRPFDWNKEFNCHTDLFAPNGTHGGNVIASEAKQSTKQGMFDCVIGNPPYMRVQTIADAHSQVKEYYEQKYKSATQRYDTYVLFLEKGLNLLKEDGLLSFIIPHKFTNSDFGIGIRKIIYENKAMNQLLSFGSEMVFENASTYTCVIGLSYNNKEFKYAQINPKDIEEQIPFEKIDIERLSNVERWSLQNNIAADLIEKLKKQPFTVKDKFKGVFQGIVTGDNKAFIIHDCVLENGIVKGYNEILETVIEIEEKICRQLLTGKTIKRYSFDNKNEYIIYPYELINDKTCIISENDLKTNYPKCYSYLLQIKKRLSSRGTEKMKYPTWYSLWNYRNIITQQLNLKILTPDICYGSSMYLDTFGYYYNDTSYALVLNEPSEISYKTYLSILNSKVCWFFLQNTGTELRGGYFRFKTKYLEPFPIPEISPDAQQNLATLVDQMLQTQAKLNDGMDCHADKSARNDGCNTKPLSPSDKQFLEQKVAMLDAQINTEVYKLYGLTKEEIAVVEGR